MERPAEKAKPWYEYRPIFITERRIREGTEFWLAHRQELDRASVRSGVPPEIHRRHPGRGDLLRAADGLLPCDRCACDPGIRLSAAVEVLHATSSSQYLLLTRELHIDPLSVKGSYAGAMGAPQFMPSNYRRFAVDADADGRIDLWSNWSDVCASVGNYLKEHGWNEGEPVLSEATVDPAKAAELDGRKLALDETVASLKAKGVAFDTALPADAPALLIAADEPDGVHWRVGYNNFYAITRYNHSALYAMAVYELAAALKQQVLASDAERAAAPLGNNP